MASRTCSNVVILSYKEEYSHEGIVAVGSRGWNSPLPPSMEFVYSNGPKIIHTYEARLVSGSETYEDFATQPTGSGGGYSQGGCHHLPYPGVVEILDVWTVDGVEYSFPTSDSGSYGLNAVLRENRFGLSVYVDWHGRHEIKDVIFANEPAEFQGIAFEFHEDVSYTVPETGEEISGRVSITMDGFGNSMSVECTQVDVPGGGGSVGPRYSGRMLQTICAPMSWALKFKPTDEQGNLVSLPIIVRFGVGSAGSYDLSRTTPIEETVSFPAHGGATTIELVRDRFGTNLAFPSPDTNDVLWDPYVASQNITGTRVWPPYFANGMTTLQYVLPSDVIGPLFSDTEADGAIPPRLCMSPYHRYHDAAEATYRDLATLTLPASHPYALGFWGQVGSTPGASVDGSELTAETDAATFASSITSTTIFAPYRWLKVTLEAESAGSATLIVRLLTGTDYEYPVSIKAGTHDYFLDLANPPNLYFKYVPKLPPTEIASLRISFADNVIEPTSCAAVVKNRAQLWVLGNGGDSRQDLPPALYGHVDGAATIQVKTEGGPGIPDTTNVREALEALDAATAIAVGPIQDEPAAWVGPLEHGGFISAFDPDADRLGAYDLIAGADLRSTCYHRRIWAYANAGGHATQMFGGGSFPGIAEFIYGGVATSTVIPSARATLIAEWPAGLSPFPPGVWRYEFSPESDGWARKATPEEPETTSGELYCLEMAEREVADGFSPTVAFSNIKANRWFTALLAEAFPVLRRFFLTADRSDPKRHFRAGRNDTGQLILQRRSNRIGEEWEDVESGLTVDWASLRVDRKHTKGEITLVTEVGGLIEIRFSRDGGETFENVQTLFESGRYPASCITDAGAVHVAVLDGPEGGPCDVRRVVLDRGRNIVIEDSVVLSGVDDAGIALVPSPAKGGKVRIELHVYQGGVLNEYVSEDGGATYS